MYEFIRVSWHRNVATNKYVKECVFITTIHYFLIHINKIKKWQHIYLFKITKSYWLSKYVITCISYETVGEVMVNDKIVFVYKNTNKSKLFSSVVYKPKGTCIPKKNLSISAISFYITNCHFTLRRFIFNKDAERKWYFDFSHCRGDKTLSASTETSGSNKFLATTGWYLRDI